MICRFLTCLLEKLMDFCKKKNVFGRGSTVLSLVGACRLPLPSLSQPGPFTKHGSGSILHSRIKTGSGRFLSTGPGLFLTRG